MVAKLKTGRYTGERTRDADLSATSAIRENGVPGRKLKTAA
jgi:hypothetical protein